MLKTTLFVLLGLFFLLNGANHLWSTHVYEEYARKRGLVSPRAMVRLSGVGLLFGGAALIGGGLGLVDRLWLLVGIGGLCIFLVVASVTIHRFWEERETELRLLEGMHFAKNMAILTELIYMATA